MKLDAEILSNKKWINAAGSAGFAPTTSLIEKFPEMGLFVTNPISYTPRSPAKERCMLPFNGGFLVHNGFPCPGLRTLLKKYQKIWENADIPVCPSLLSDHPSQIEKIVRIFESIENIVGIELYLEPSLAFEDVEAMIKASLGELPIILCIPYEFVYSDRIDRLASLDIMAISIQPPRGSIFYNQKMVNGRLYGPAMFPLTLRAIKQLSVFKLPIIAGLGALTIQDIENVYEVGAHNFQPHELIWRDYF